MSDGGTCTTFNSLRTLNEFFSFHCSAKFCRRNFVRLIKQQQISQTVTVIFSPIIAMTALALSF